MQLITEIGDWTCSHLPLRACLSTPCDLSLDAIFSHTVCEFTEYEAREEIWSSVNYLFFIATSLTLERTNKLDKVKSFERCA